MFVDWPLEQFRRTTRTRLALPAARHRGTAAVRDRVRDFFREEVRHLQPEPDRARTHRSEVHGIRVLSVGLFAAALGSASGCDLLDSCQGEGPQTSSVSLAISADLAARHGATRVKMCATDGRCETHPVPSPPASRALHGPLAFTEAQFTHVLPTRVTRQGSAGPSVQLTAALYSGNTLVLTSRATLGPVTMNPGTGRTCHYKGYWVSAELRSDGTLNYHRLA